jgi:cytochrome c oxidase cbb3-type subunit I/II
MVRPFVDETVRYGEYSKPGEFVYDHPFQWGSRRIGPDLHRQGGRRNNLWLYRHFELPVSTSPGSVMPPYPHLITDTIDWSAIGKRIDALAMLGVPYGPQILSDAGAAARAQAVQVADQLAAEGGPKVSPDREVLALIAYMQRLGIDIKTSPATVAEKEGK